MHGYRAVGTINAQTVKPGHLIHRMSAVYGVTETKHYSVRPYSVQLKLHPVWLTPGIQPLDTLTLGRCIPVTIIETIK